MKNFLNAWKEEIGDESVLGVVFRGPLKDWAADGRDRLPKDKIGKVLSWEEAQPILDYQWYDGYGGRDCHDVVVWTDKRVCWVHEYDGSTCLVSEFRDPTSY